MEDDGSISFRIGELKGHIDGGALFPKVESRRGAYGKTVVDLTNDSNSEVASSSKPFFDAFEFGWEFKSQ